MLSRASSAAHAVRAISRSTFAAAAAAAAAASAPASASAAAAAAASLPGRSPSATLSAQVRAVLRASPEPLRLSALWSAVSQSAPPSLRSRTHFKRRIVGAMEARGELVKCHVAEAVKGKGERDFFAFRLKNITRNYPVGLEVEVAAAPAAAGGARACGRGPRRAARRLPACLPA